MKALKLNIRLGSSRNALPMVAAPDTALLLLGVVQRGMEVGYLAQLPSGEYVQANGSMLRPLNASQVRAAMRKAGAPPPAKDRTVKQPPVIVIHKKRRTVSPETGMG